MGNTFTWLWALALLQGALGAAVPETDSRIRYDNYAVYKVKYESVEQRNLLEKLTEDRANVRLWHEAKDELHLMISPQSLSEFQTKVRQANASAEIFIANVQDLIDMETTENSRGTSDEFGWKRYNSLAQIEAWLDEILARYPVITEGFIVGQSYEGRTIRGIKISYKSGNPGVFIESNIHAREWITSATATWLINQFLTSEDPLVRTLAESHDWYIVPVLNVDGFVYTHEKDRMWRKTRQPSATSSCIGADPNRNYDSHWMENNGASSNPCAENYGGPQPFSEPEIKAMSEFVAGIKDKVNVMLAFHSYSQLLLSPYGHTEEELPPNYDDLMEVAKAYADAVEAMPYGTVYRYGTASGILYIASGATNDWAYNEQDIQISYTIEFRDTGHYGFILPPVHIVPNAEEALFGIAALLDKCKELGYLAIKY
ncbi:zinc carboxypeptidase [Drosophila guanche]|uniref:Blast:Zinc carboxypeptidase A 1 n=1 Tax=Drosophila guanche TaxID=7266 RepID=A0A3B0K3R4_DROGU|nr:zinc carboxypeptidase [Drosophila guanche]SPP79671.1 blast:Zinc carboxypeptidase A 1 [Drosophila guanche]